MHVPNFLPSSLRTSRIRPALGRPAAGVTALALVAASLLTAVVTAPAAGAATTVEATFTDQLNAARAERGLPPLEARPALVSVARQQAARMADRATLYHNPNLTSDVANWQWVGENVGYGPDALTVHVAFMSSPGHRANILDRDYTQVGVGAVVRDGRVWVAEVFRRPLRVHARASSSDAVVAAGRTLRLGSTGPAVRRLQTRLGLPVTGVYGQATKAAVSRFQKRLGWAGRGNCGPHTWARLF